MTSKGEYIFSFALLTMIVWFVVEAFSYRMQVRITPLIIGIPAAILMTWKIISDIVKPKVSPSKLDREHELTEKENFKARREYMAFFTLTLFVLLICFFGFLVAVPLYLFLQLKVFSSENWLTSLAVPIGAGIFSYILFEIVFEIPLFEGFLNLHRIF